MKLPQDQPPKVLHAGRAVGCVLVGWLAVLLVLILKAVVVVLCVIGWYVYWIGKISGGGGI